MAERAAHLIDHVFPDVPVRQWVLSLPYALRPPVTQERIHLTDEGQVRLQLRQPWRDGTTDVVFDPVELLGRLAVLVPRPRINLRLYYGVLGPRAAWRSEVVPSPASEDGRDTGGEGVGRRAGS